MRPVRVVAAFLALALSLPGAAEAAPSAQDGPPLGNVDGETLGTVAVLGLDAEDLEVGTRMTAALRRAVEGSGLTLGGTASLSEVRLIGGCADNSEECLVSGALGVTGDQLLYGTLVPRDDGSTVLELSLLDVGVARVVASARLPLDPRALEPDTVDETATEALSLVIALPQPEATPVDEEPVPVVIADDPPPSKKGELIWGPHAPRPKWKKALLGTSVGLVVVGAAFAGLAFGGRRSLQDEVVREAEASLDTVAPVDPDQGTQQMCDQALNEPDPVSQPGDVYNADVGRPCRQGMLLTRVGTAMIVVGSIGLLGTIAGTTLFFVRRAPAKNARIAPEISRDYAGVQIRARF